MHLLLLHGTQAEFDVAEERFGGCNTVLVTDRMTLIQRQKDGSLVEGVLKRDDELDVGHLNDWEIVRDGDRLVVRIEGKAYATTLPDRVVAAFINVGAGPGLFGGSRGVKATIRI